MKRTNLTTAVIAGIAGIAGISNMASAVYLNGDGLGQVLVYPYYTVNASNGSNNSTVVTIVNTTNQGKAVKVRFLEGYNSREVLDFNLYMSPYDVWSAQLVATASGGAGIFSTDNSCTVPALPRSSPGFPFSTLAFDGTGTVFPADGGPTSVTRTAEGYVEMIEMGTVTNVNDGSLTALTHVNGTPANCAQLINAWTANSANPYWLANNSNDIAAASGGLFGSGTIVNVNEGTVEGYNAEAIDRFWATGGAPGHTFLHSTPSSLNPNLGDAPAGSTSYVFAQATTGAGGQLITTTYARGIDAITSLFMADTIYNEYWTTPAGTGINNSSEWVVTFPTKRFYVDPFFVPSVSPPFDVLFTSAVGNNGLAGSSCSPIGVNYYDREERSPGVQIGQICPSPLVCGPVAVTTSLCYEANVVTFNQPGTEPGTNSVILGSSLLTQIETGFNNGWANIDLTNGGSSQHELLSGGTSDNTFLGLPGTGFWVTEFQNGAIQGVLSNYTSLYRHKFHRACNAGEGTCS